MNTPSTFFDGIDTHIPTASGGNIYTVDGYVIHEFTASATFYPAKTANYEFFMVGRGGQGENPGGGGGGGGEVVLGSIKLISGSSYSFNPDAGSIPSVTTFAGITAYQGGEGGRDSLPAGQNGYSGGSGTGGSGGGAADGPGAYQGGDSSAANGLINYLFRYGNRGGNSPTDRGAGGGGGAGSAGENGTRDGLLSPVGGNGGNGISNDWLGSIIYYGGGGGGSTGAGGTAAGVGNGGGGNGAIGLANADNARANSGGGGGGSDVGTPGNGALGILLIRYKTDV
jgi:hypothetical protein